MAILALMIWLVSLLCLSHPCPLALGNDARRKFVAGFIPSTTLIRSLSM
jgi:hypothetical protein